MACKGLGGVLVQRVTWPGGEGSSAHSSGSFSAPWLLCDLRSSEPQFSLLQDGGTDAHWLGCGEGGEDGITEPLAPRQHLASAGSSTTNCMCLERQWGIKFTRHPCECYSHSPGKCAARPHFPHLPQKLRTQDLWEQILPAPWAAHLAYPSLSVSFVT